MLSRKDYWRALVAIANRREDWCTMVLRRRIGGVEQFCSVGMIADELDPGAWALTTRDEFEDDGEPVWYWSSDLYGASPLPIEVDKHLVDLNDNEGLDAAFAYLWALGPELHRLDLFGDEACKETLDVVCERVAYAVREEQRSCASQ